MGEDAWEKMRRDALEWQRCCEVRGARVMQSVLQDRVVHEARSWIDSLVDWE